MAATLINMAVVQISLNGFDNAVRAYHEARAFCEQHDMPLLTLRADYNIAGLYYLRGEYTRRAGNVPRGARRRAIGWAIPTMARYAISIDRRSISS